MYVDKTRAGAHVRECICVVMCADGGVQMQFCENERVARFAQADSCERMYADNCVRKIYEGAYMSAHACTCLLTLKCHVHPHQSVRAVTCSEMFCTSGYVKVNAYKGCA
eukprot:6176319-Pleurochrysis_carterae.AAC.1